MQSKNIFLTDKVASYCTWAQFAFKIFQQQGFLPSSWTSLSLYSKLANYEIFLFLLLFYSLLVKGKRLIAFDLSTIFFLL